jgi:PAS domain S-box-containing protein
VKIERITTITHKIYDTLNPWLWVLGLILSLTVLGVLLSRNYSEWQNAKTLCEELTFNQCNNITAQVSLRIENIFHERANDLAVLAALWQSSPEDRWEELFLIGARQFLLKDPSYRSFRYIDAKNRLRFSTHPNQDRPLAVSCAGESQILLELIKFKHSPGSSSPRFVTNDNFEIDLYYPIYTGEGDDSVFQGAAVCAINLQDIIRKIDILSSPTEFCIHTSIKKLDISSSPHENTPHKTPFKAFMWADIYGMVWSVNTYLQPTSKFNVLFRNNLIRCLFNAAISLLISIFLFLLLNSLIRMRISRRQLRQTENRFRQLAENIQEVFWLFDVNAKKIIYMSPAYERIWGKPLDNLYRDPLDWLNAVHPGDYDKVSKSLTSPENRTKTELRYRIIRSSGETRWILSRGFPICDQTGQVMRIAGVAEDATESQEKEEALRASEKTLRQIIDLVPHMIFAKNKYGRILLANQMFASTYGLHVETIANRHHADIHPCAEEVDRFLQDDRTVFDSGNPSFIARETFTDCENQIRILQTTRIPFIIPNLDEPAILGISIDISKQEEAENERIKLEDKLRHSQKLEAIGHLAGGVAHDFNNLLTGIIGYSNLVLRNLKPDDLHYRNIREIQKAGEQAAELTHQLLAFSRKQILEPKILCLSDLIAGMESMLRRLIGEDVDINANLDPSRDYIKADPAQITQIIINLAVNARDAMPNGGSLTIETTSAVIGEAYAHQHVDNQPGPYVLLTVSDNGCGMDKTTLNHIFEPFFTTKEPGKGTGLGLSTVYGIVKQSGGNIHVYSKPGNGTTFRIYFPQVDGKTASAHPKSQQTESLQGHETILLVEDDDIVCQMSANALQEYGYTVLKALDAFEAYTIFEQSNKPIQLLLTDVVLPKESGRMVAEKLTALNPALKVLFMSGYTNEAIVYHGILEEGIAFLHKPFTAETLARKVREVLTQS